MDVFTQLFIKALEGQKIEVCLPDTGFNLSEKIESVSLATLRRIREIVMDDTLNDAECFKKLRKLSAHTKNWDSTAESGMISAERFPPYRI